MLLTEGAVAGIARGGRFRIVSLYTRSPLVWGIHVPADSPIRSENDLRGARYAISRIGSGSHLMAYVHARERGWREELVFQTVGSLDGAIEAFAAGRADVFLWEKFMTKPVVDAGRFRRVAEFVAPWPAFVVCASERALRDKREAVAATLDRVLAVAATVAADPSTPANIAARYGLLASDAAEWLAATQWAQTPGIDPALVEDVAQLLADAGVIEPRGGTFTASLPK
jgi:ABC-type nitrate/sulfonate/bicarbonate transport system substrate-binding protein